MSQRASAAPKKPVSPSTVSLAGPVQLAVPDPLIVQMAKEKEPPKRDWLPFLILTLILSTVLYVLAWARWIHPREHPNPVIYGPGLAVHLSYPRYLAVGDVGEIEVSVVNRATQAISDTQTLSGTLTLLFDPAPGVHVANDEGTVLRFKDLPGGGQVTGRVKFAWNTAPRWINVGDSSFQAWISLADGQQQKLELEPPPKITFAPLPYLDTALDWLRNTVILVGLGGLLWEQIKKRLFPSA